MTPSTMTMQEYFTPLAADEVLVLATRFFTQRSPIYAAFPDQHGPGWASFRGQGGEEIVVAAAGAAGGSRVTGSSYLFTMQVARFFATLPAMDVPVEVA